jgi:hypothetical protein
MIGNEIQFTRRYEVYHGKGGNQDKHYALHNEISTAAQHELEQQLFDAPMITSWEEVEKREISNPGGQLKKRLQDAVAFALKPILERSPQTIPGFFDKFRQHNFLFKNYDIEIIEYEKGRRSSVKLRVHFHSVECLLLDHFGTELLIALGEQTSVSRNGRKQLSTLCVYLNEDTSIGKYVPYDRILLNQER